jgi:hypothetical protein
MLASAAAVPAAAGAGDPDPAKAFAGDWEGRRVVLTRAMYTMVYDEIGRLGMTRRGKLAGLTVVTPSDTYFRFEGRQDHEDVVDRDPNRVFTQTRIEYQRAKHLDIGTVSTIAPMMLVRYEPGVALRVARLEFERDRVRLVLHRAEDSAAQELATTLTVQWPVPLSKGLSERPAVEAAIAQFIAAPSADGAASR